MAVAAVMGWLSGDSKALTLIQQHMHDCELRASRVETRLDDQDQSQERMHAQNTVRLDTLEKDAQARFTKLMFMIVTGLVTMVGSLILEIVRGGHF